MNRSHLSPTVNPVDTDATVTCGASAHCPRTDAPHVAQASHPAPAEAPRFEHALASVVPAMEALEDSALEPIHVDIAEAYTTVKVALPGLLALRPRLAALPEFDLEAFDKLPVYVEAAFYAHSLYTQMQQAWAATATLAADCELRLKRLVIAVDPLVREELLPANALANHRAETGYRAVAMELLALVDLLRSRWATLEGNTALTPAKLDGAHEAARQLLDAVIGKEAAELATDPLSRQQQRAFTLFARAYRELRRGVGYLLFYTGDADTTAPPLTHGRTATPTAPAAGAPAPAVGTASAAPVAAPVAAPAPVKFNATLAALSGDASKIPNFASAVPKPFANS